MLPLEIVLMYLRSAIVDRAESLITELTKEIQFPQKKEIKGFG